MVTVPNKQLLEDLKEILNMSTCKPVGTPATKSWSYQAGDQEELSAADHSLYRTAVGKLLFIAQDRADIKYATNECARDLATPTGLSMRKLKRVVKYVEGTAYFGDNALGTWSKTQTTVATSTGEAEYVAVPQVGERDHSFSHRRDGAVPPPATGFIDAVVGPVIADKMEVFCDSDWAAGSKTSGSTSGIVLKVDGNTLGTWSKTQSSGEAEQVKDDEMKEVAAVTVRHEKRLKAHVRGHLSAFVEAAMV